MKRLHKTNKRILIYFVFIGVLIYFSIIRRYPLDKWGFYSWNLTGVYERCAHDSGLFIVCFPKKLNGASINNFEILHIEPSGCIVEKDCLPQFGYARSGNYIYFKGDIIKDADTRSFKYIEDGYAIDSSKVFYRGSYLNYIDVNSFVSFGNNLVSDKSYYYYRAFPVMKKVSENNYLPIEIGLSKVVRNVGYMDVEISENGKDYRIVDQISVKEEGGIYFNSEYGEPGSKTIYWAIKK